MIPWILFANNTNAPTTDMTKHKKNRRNVNPNVEIKHKENSMDIIMKPKLSQFVNKIMAKIKNPCKKKRLRHFHLQGRCKKSNVIRYF